MATHPLISTFRNLDGNARGCVLTEPLWGIPFQLYVPYLSVYMLALGLGDRQIGLVTSIGLFFQVIAGLLGGALTDKLGRKRATFIFDMLSWSIPCLLWAFAQDFSWFLVAAIFNSMWRIPMTSWTCLLVEDTDPKLLVDIYTWIYIAGLLSAFFAPISGALIDAFSLVPTLRGIFLLAFVLMTAKFIILNNIVDETKQGVIRMKQAEGESIASLLSGYRGVFSDILRAPETLYTVGIMLVISICSMVNTTFWSVLITGHLHIPPEHLAYYPFARAVVMLLVFFFVTPLLKELPFKKPMLAGFISIIISQIILVTAPDKNYWVLLISVVLEAFSMAALNPQVDRLLVVTVEAQERARIMSILYVIIITFTTPFGWIAGELSSLNRVYPFMLNILFYSAGVVLTMLAARAALKKKKATA